MPPQIFLLDSKDLERFVKRVQKMLADGVSMSEVARHFNTSRTTIQKRLKRWESLQKESS